ncbi:MAG: Mu-like prophage major head subunit gpT family protein [Desulfovibrionaceae bacterium]
MIITNANLSNLFIAYNAAFKQGLGMAVSQYEKVSMTIPSGTSANIYPWLGNLPSMRKWVGDRIIKNLKAHDYTIKNEPFEVTVSVERDTIEDDQYGIYTPMFQDLGSQTVIHPNQLVFDQLKHGHERTCYDGQYFFDTDHPVADKSVSNTLIPSQDPSVPWYLLCTTRPVRPVIFQRRRPYTLTRMDRPDDEQSFMRGAYLYGVDARVNVGYGLWQLAVRSTKVLDNASYAEARALMSSYVNDEGNPLGLVPNMLVVPSALESAARKVVVSALTTGGATNEWAGSAELLVSPWL